MINSTRIFNIVFDIDGLLACSKVRDKDEIKFYQQRGLVILAYVTHYIFPGVAELMKRLFLEPDVRLSFFSSAFKERNDLFVKKLLKHSLGKEQYLKVKEDTLVLSKTDLDKISDEEGKKQYQQYGLYQSSEKKSLKKVLRSGDALEDSMLIDDIEQNVKYGQEGNYLGMSCIDSCYYKDMLEFYSYNEDGYRLIPIWDCTSHKNLKDLVIHTTCIGLLIGIEKCTLCFFNTEKKQYDELEIHHETNDILLKAIKAHYQKKKKLEKSSSESCEMTREELNRALYALIEENQGKTMALDLKVNRICYIAGIIFKAIEHARKGSTLAEFLLPLHFLPDEKKGTFIPRKKVLSANLDNEEYYHYGLEKLQEVNPQFTFINARIYKECLAKEVSEEEEKVLQNFHKNDVKY